MKRIKNRPKYHYYIVLLFQCFILSCAQITTPTGGPPDKIPPKVKSSNPANFSTNFHQKTISVLFDEWLQPLTNAKSQVIISPDITPFPTITIAKNEMTIKLKDSLLPNTTYSFFFGDNLKDNHEGNILSNYKYLFSTGKYIDSLKIKGKITTSLDKIPDNTFLTIYSDLADSAFTKKRPFYISKINTDGSFSLENVKEGKYRVFALNDKNGNYYYDLPTEAIGFTDSIFTIKSNLDTLNFELFLPEDSLLRIFDFDRTIKGGILHLTFNKELSFNKDEITVSVLENTKIQPIAFQDKDAKRMTVYFPKLEKDTNSFTLIIKDNNRLVDTLRLRTESKQYKNPVLFFTDTTTYKSLRIIQSQPLTLVSSFYTMEKIDSNKITITDTSNHKIAFSISAKDDLQTFNFNADFLADMKYKISILDSALIDLVGNYNKKQEISFLATNTKKAGNLLITYELPTILHNYIAILKDNSDKVLDKQILRDSQRVKINYGLLPAGTYSIEVIDDVNNNGIWNSGNFNQKTLPEKIYKETKPIIIKENWDAEEIIKVDFSNNFHSSPINKESKNTNQFFKGTSNPNKLNNNSSDFIEK